MDKTFIPSADKIKVKWHLIDARGKILGRLASRAAKILSGKDKFIFTPHINCGDGLIIINARHISVSGRKLKQKFYKRYSGYPGGLRETSLEQVLKDKPEEAIRHAVKGMLPKGHLGAMMFKRLRVYASAEYAQQAQKPQIIE